MADHNNLIITKLTSQLECLTSLASLLEEELTVIASRKGNGLKEIATKKTPFLSKLNILDKELNKLITSNDELSVESQDLIKQVRQQLVLCKKQNDVNAHAAHHAQLSVKQLKDILIGAPTTTMAYDQAGSAVNSENSLVRNLKA
ncbi:flagellar protein FlgN [Pseudoalteromonas sp. MMG010]|uniref:flagellar protein FlgN n=1 Tax=Pseudoalteromonas sp. MMG010 TaxID=2822685 RepID=UPI001B39CF12|nr:flagellar protein FlgN [Pseudoalteromonas sp. MMG010]MBQ4831814.1 flagellar protein FlgN [Pseudoalteromonas sp. MMG010]